MKQNTNLRTATSNNECAENDGPSNWGNWYGCKRYDLEVVQQPLRARMCGFGDKDRRPLAPAAVARMTVRREDHSIVDADEVDYSFFLVTVDLWSADGKREMNLVSHPSSTESRYTPSHGNKHKRRGTSGSTSTSHQHSEHQTPVISHSVPTTPIRSSGDSQAAGVGVAIPSPQGYTGGQVYSLPPQQSANMPESLNFQSSTYVPSSADPSCPSWMYSAGTVPRSAATYQTSVLSPGSHYCRGNAASGITTAETWNSEDSSRSGNSPDVATYRPWQADSSYPTLHNAAGHAVFGNTDVDASLRTIASSQHPSNSDGHETAWQTQQMSSGSELARHSQNSFTTPGAGSNHPIDGSAYPASYHHQQPPPQNNSSTYYPTAHYSQTSSFPPQQSCPPLPRHQYTRTLVGPLSANACRLLDENKNPGIFFLFQDLSVRTEGTFRLRLRLMNVGAPPAPESGAVRVHTSLTPVLAQAFTNSFVVFSAKRFPGVPDTTALSIAFGNQGQKLPLRNRHGSIKQGRRRRRDDSDGSDDNSDGG